MELTDAISGYVIKRLESIKKFVKDDDIVSGYVEIGKTTNHHKQGDVLYKAEFDIKINDERYFINTEEEDLYAAIDKSKDDIVNKITHNRDRKKTLFKRGASSLKKMIKGISDRNPFTSR